MTKESKTSATIRRRRCVGPGLRQAVLRHKVPSADDNLDEDEDDLEFLHQEVVLSSPVLRLIMSSQWTMFLGLLAFRVINALIIQTSYVPDEYWQSIEVAHNMAFGYGHLTWEWRTGLRSYAYPLLIATIYKGLALIHLDYTILLIKLPRLLHAVFAASGDLYLYKLSCKLAGPQVAAWSLLCQLTSWFTFFCSTRTLSNSVETVLTTVALYYFPWPGRPRKAHWKFISLVGLCIVIRPTAAIVWLPLCVWYLLLWRHVAWKVIKMVAERGFVILSISSIIDRVFYGRWVYVHYNFLQFNVLSNMGTFYGSHTWHWYITQGFTVVMGAQMIPFILALRRGVEPVFLTVIAWTVFVYRHLKSNVVEQESANGTKRMNENTEGKNCLGHKEFRFLFPILPLAMHVCGVYIHYLTTDAWPIVQQKVAQAQQLIETSSATTPPPDTQSDQVLSSETDTQVSESQPADLTKSQTDSNTQPPNTKSNTEPNSKKSRNQDCSRGRKSKENPETYFEKFIDHCTRTKKGLDSLYMWIEYYTKQFWRNKRFVVTALIATNLPIALYTSVLHQRGTLDVMKYVSDLGLNSTDGQANSVMYLMPCHSTPYYGFVHQNISMRFLTCEPNLMNITDYIDEAGIFYADPKQWLKDETDKMSENSSAFTNNHMPSHIVMFNVLLPNIEAFLTVNHYHECKRFFHSHFPEGRVGSHVVVMCHEMTRRAIFHGNRKLHDAFSL